MVKKPLRIATFNVNSVRGRLPILERWLSDSKVDLLFLQETKVVDADFPEAAFSSMGYQVYFCGEKSYNGVAVAARESVKGLQVRFGFGDGRKPDFLTRVAVAEAPGAFKFLNTYVPQGKEITHEDYQMKKKFLERARAFLEREAADAPFAWVGDLNVAPRELDVTRPENKKDHVCFHADIREKFAWVLSWGLTDLFRRFHPDAVDYTFFDYRLKDALSRNVGWRIDHILANESLMSHAVACFIDREPRGWEKPSDHTPLVADFRM
ncbi:MAG: exodeoxyribonuclease III [Synergistaceae bacterium]|jgi:exodeoxyribonuclease-3|nr:exodeoxyribonuclease III [Synergistaceae bacterium]